MASFKLNMASIRECLPAAELAAAMREYGTPEIEEYGVLSCSAANKTAWATILRRSTKTVKQFDAEAGELVDKAVEKVDAYPFMIDPVREVLEVYAGSKSSIEYVGVFLAGCLALPTVVTEIPLDVLSAVEKLHGGTQRFRIKAVKVSDYAHNAYGAGTYGPKFLDTVHADDFAKEFVENLQAVRCEFQGPSKKVGVTVQPLACFGFTCHEDDVEHVRGVLRKLI